MITNDTMPNNSNETYFAAKAGNETANILLDKAKSFYNFMEANAYMVKLRNMWRAYHGAYGDYMGYGHRTEFTGEQGELVMLPVNHFRNLAQHMLNMVTASRPVMDARAVNTDYKSLSQTYLANGILSYYMREKHLEDAFKKAVEYAIVLGAGFIKMEWNATAGEMYDYDEETGQPNYEGEIEFSTYTPLDVVMDGTKENWNHDWIMVRSFQNRFNLIAKYPELADKIKGVPSKTDSTIMRLAVFSNDGTDDIPVYEFYHKKTEALPNGRYLLFLDNDIVLLDTDLPYRVVPVFRIAPSDILGTPYGYTPMFDIFPIQECINSLYSTIMTNQNAFGVQNLFVPNGSDLAISTLEGGMNIMKGNAKPEAVNLTQTPKEVFEFLQILISSAETISGVNSVARGNPESSLRSGNALALVQSMALQFISGLQQSYVKMIEDTGTALIQILKDFADTPKMVTLVGKNNRTLLKEFTGEDLSAINRVIVDMGNALSQTVAGRVQMAEQMMQMKIIQNPNQYFEVMNTGRLDVTFEGQMSELLLIKRENEKLMEGSVIQALSVDQHKEHIMEHKAVIADPDLRFNPEIVKNTLDHIQQHINLLQTTNPDLLQIIGEQPLKPPAPPTPPMQMPPAGAPMPPGAPQGGPPPPFPSMLPQASPMPQQGMPPQPQHTGHPKVANPNTQHPKGLPGLPSAHSMKASPVGQLMTNETGMVAPGQTQINSEQGRMLVPGLPRVNANLLPNPQLQENALNNVKIPRHHK